MSKVQIMIRLDEFQVKMLDEKIELLQIEVPGVTWDRAAAIKYLAMMMSKPTIIEPVQKHFDGDTTLIPGLGQITYT